MNITWDTDVYCLIGHPISKSLSPIIHNNFYEIIGKKSIYLAFDVEEEDLESVVNTFKTLNIKGFNVTLPHKVKIIEYLDEISAEAKLIGAVNTVKNENGKLIGYNTDSIGFLKSLDSENFSIKDKTILILGSGGAANAISTSVAAEGAKKICINNRSIINAEKLSKKIKKQFPRSTIECGDLEFKNISKDEFDIVINCTSVGMYPNTEESPINLDGFSKDLVVYDIIYKPQKTKFLQLGEDRGYITIGGLSMLINQALSSQQIWLDNSEENIYKNYDKIKRILKTFVE